MKIQDLIERLQDIAGDYPDAEVMLAVQPGYPLAETLRGVASPNDDDSPYDGDEVDPVQDYSGGKVWLVSGGQSSSHDVSPYAPGWVFDAAC